jgi:hypothetical protein
MTEPRTFSLNVYHDPIQGRNRILWSRDKSGVEWERRAVKDNWWQLGHLIPAYVIHVKEKPRAPHTA